MIQPHMGEPPTPTPTPKKAPLTHVFELQRARTMYHLLAVSNCSIQ